MNFAKTIEMFLVNGTADGLIIAKMKNWNGKAIKIPRSEINDYKREELKNVGVYFLFCNDDEGNESVYVGEAEDVYVRLKQHIQDYKADKEKYYWNTAVAFTGDDLTKTTIRYLENLLVEKIKAAKKYKMLTINTYKQTVISEADEAAMSEFIYNIEILINALGYKAFEEIQSEETVNTEIFHLSGAGAEAKGFISDRGFTVFKGSKVSDHVAPSFDKYCKYTSRLRQKLVDDGVLVNNEFVVDYEFSSPSYACDVILGRSSSGPKEWKNSKNISLRECL